MNQTEKNLFIAVCGVFVISVSVFIILMIITEPDIKAPTKYLPGKPVVEYSDLNVATDQVPAQALVASTTAAKSVKTFCRDSDNGLAYDQFGITFDQFGNDFSDTCISDRIIREYYCEDNQLKQSDITCNTSCVSGVCN